MPTAKFQCLLSTRFYGVVYFGVFELEIVEIVIVMFEFISL